MIIAPTLETERLILRGPDMRDWDAFLAFLRTDRSEFVREGTMSDMKIWRAFGHFVGHWVLRGFGLFVLVDKATEKSIGSVGCWYPFGWPEHELAWSIWDENFEHKGYAKEAAIAVRSYGFGTLKLPSLVSYIEEDNKASVMLAEKLGCQIDRQAKTPDGEACLVFRHPKAEALL